MAVGAKHGQIFEGCLSFAVGAAQRLAMVHLAEVLQGGPKHSFEVEVAGLAAEPTRVGLHLAFLSLHEGLIPFSSEVAIPPLFALSARHENAIVHVGEPLSIS